MLHDFHTHTFLSDGCLSPLELIRRASVAGYAAIALTDHVGIGSLARVINEIKQDCALARTHWNIQAIPGVELTHVPPAAIAEVAREARELGALLVVVHGETLVEPVAPGTNLAAIHAPCVDLLAHPGTLTEEQATQAARNGVFIEITTRKGHSQSNASVASTAERHNALTIVNSDAHEPQDLLTPELVVATALAAHLPDSLIYRTIETNPSLLLERINQRH